jgi:hypothetical protein
VRTGKSGPGQVLDQIETKAPFLMKKQKETHWSELGRMCSFVPGQKVDGMKPLAEAPQPGKEEPLLRGKRRRGAGRGCRGGGGGGRRRLRKLDTRESRRTTRDVRCPERVTAQRMAAKGSGWSQNLSGV